MGAPIGNQNARKRHWSTAIQLAVMEVDPVTKKRQLDRIAERLLKMAEAGDIQAIKEVGDRLDGKAIQAIDATVDANVTVNVLRFTDAIDAGAGDADGQST